MKDSSNFSVMVVQHFGVFEKIYTEEVCKALSHGTTRRRFGVLRKFRSHHTPKCKG